jgi:hypothetical protein
MFNCRVKSLNGINILYKMSLGFIGPLSCNGSEEGAYFCGKVPMSWASLVLETV